MSTDLYQAQVSVPDAGRPLVFAFHGTGGDEHQLFGLAGQLVPGAGVISPLGDVSEAGMARFFRRTGEGVYDMQDLERATGKMTAFIEAYRAKYPQSAVYAFGYSNGANILASVFFKRPDLFDRTAYLHPLVTWQPEDNTALHGRKLLVTAGTRDPITPWPMSQQLITWLSEQGADVTTEIHDGGHELRNSEITALAKLLAGPSNAG